MTVLSGAGISAESGVPTFRDVETGLWAKVDPYEISSADGWRRHPEKVWAWYLWRHYMMKAVEPNDGHRAVAAWQDDAEVHVVTQNVDDLHERAGSQRVYHLHGSLFEFRCDRCGRAYLGALPAMPEPVETVDAAAVPVRRPDPAQRGVVRRAAARRSVGAVGRRRHATPTSRSWSARRSIVYPAAGLPELALAKGIPVIEVNPEETPLSDAATISLREPSADGAARPAAATARPARLTRFRRMCQRRSDAPRADRGLGDRHAAPMRASRARDGCRPPRNPAPAIDRLGVAMGVAVAQQPRPHRGVGDLLQPATEAAARDVLEVAQLTARTHQREQLSQNGIGVVDRAQHQRAHDGVERRPSVPARYLSTVPALTVTGTGAVSAACPRLRLASRRSGSIATTSVTVVG